MNWDTFLSAAARDIPPSAIRRFFDLASETKGVLSLSIGEPDFVTPWHVREAGITSLEHGHTHYSPNAGFLALRQAISTYLADRFELEYRAEDEILVTVGGSEAIDLAVRAIVNPGDEVIITEPCFVSYKACVRLAGGVPVIIECTPENGFKPTAEQLAAAISPRTKLLIIGYPNNPTGAVLDREDLSELVTVLADKPIVVLSDELYAELTYEPHSHVSIGSFPVMREKTLIVNGFSKAFAMTGWRLGYAAGPGPLIALMKKIHQYAIMCSPTTAQEAALVALNEAEKLTSEMRQVYDLRRHLVVKACREMQLPCFEPGGAFYAFPDIRSTGLRSGEFCELFLQEEKVAIVPGEAFGDSGAGYVRISYATATDTLREALHRLNRFVERWRNFATI